jgi:hypothetical protein
MSNSKHSVQEQVDPSVEKIKFKSQKGLMRMGASVFVIQKPFRIHVVCLLKTLFFCSVNGLLGYPSLAPSESPKTLGTVFLDGIKAMF